jgi:hypothetical protein
VLVSQPKAFNQVMLSSLGSFRRWVFVEVVKVVEIVSVESDNFFVDSSVLCEGVIVFVDRIELLTY